MAGKRVFPTRGGGGALGGRCFIGIRRLGTRRGRYASTWRGGKEEGIKIEKRNCIAFRRTLKKKKEEGGGGNVISKKKKTHNRLHKSAYQV